MNPIRVLLCLGEDKISLINDRCAKLAEYPAALVALCGTCADDRRFFGLVTLSRRDPRLASTVIAKIFTGWYNC